MVFSGTNRRLYEEVLFRMYRHFFSAEVIFPRRQDVEHFIYRVLTDNPTLWHDEDEMLSFTDLRSDKRRLRRVRKKTGSSKDEATDRAMLRARHIYVRLVNTGWLEESHFGMRINVDMPHGAMRLAQFLSDLREDISTNYSGLVVQIRQAVHACKSDPEGQGMGLRQAADSAVRFTRSLRSIFSTLKAIERSMLEAEGLKERLRTLMEDFVGQLFLKDFKELHTSSHPASHQSEIVLNISDIQSLPATIEVIGQTYLRNNVHGHIDDCRDQVQSDLESLSLSFRRIDALFETITQFRLRLEGKLRSTIRYAGINTEGLRQSVRPVIQQLNDILNRCDNLETTPGQVPSLACDVPNPISADLLATPRTPRKPVGDVEIEIREKDPFVEWLKEMKRRFGNRIDVSPKVAMRFLEKQIPPQYTQEANYIKVETIDDALALIAVRTAAYRNPQDDAFTRKLRQHFEFDVTHGMEVENKFFRCDGFRIKRIGDHQTLPDAFSE